MNKPTKEFLDICKRTGRDPKEFKQPSERDAYVKAWHRTDKVFEQHRRIKALLEEGWL